MFDLEDLHGSGHLPFEDEQLDEIHAYEIIEHFGLQGDFKGFFREFGEYWRVLKPEGLMCISCPMWDSPWSFADPGHCRVLPKEVFGFLTKAHYDQIEGERDSSCTDYRSFIDGRYWEVLGVEESTDQMYVVLQKV